MEFKKLAINISLENYLEKDDDPSSYFNSLHQILEKLEEFA